MKKSSSLNIYIMLILAALEILMSFTFLGYFHIPPISITFAYIPVVMAAYLLGPAGAAVIGAVFGLASVYKATASYVQPTDQIFSPFLSGRPLASFLLAVGARVLFGFLIGLIFRAAKKKPASENMDRHYRSDRTEISRSFGVFCDETFISGNYQKLSDGIFFYLERYSCSGGLRAALRSA